MFEAVDTERKFIELCEARQKSELVCDKKSGTDF
jgi:hypothetical protein